MKKKKTRNFCDASTQTDIDNNMIEELLNLQNFSKNLVRPKIISNVIYKNEIKKEDLKDNKQIIETKKHLFDKNNINIKNNKKKTNIDEATKGITKKSEVVQIKDIYYNKKEGFNNYGSTCYLNSFVQIFIHIPGLINSLKDYINNIQKNTLLYNILELADDSSYNKLSNLRNIFCRYNPNYKYYYQEDSQEFGSEFIKILNAELYKLKLFINKWELEGFDSCNKTKNTSKKKIEKLQKILEEDDCEFKNETLITSYFYFFETELLLCNNKPVHYNFYGDVDIQLSFNLKKKEIKQITLIDLFNNKYLYGNSKLIKLPKILMITLLRAIINQPLIKTKVEINDELDLKEFLDKDFGNYSLSTKYSLYALNICYGSYKRSGHYYSYILINDNWYRFDDMQVNEVNYDAIKEDLEYVYGIYYINKGYLKTIERIDNR